MPLQFAGNGHSPTRHTSRRREQKANKKREQTSGRPWAGEGFHTESGQETFLMESALKIGIKKLCYPSKFMSRFGNQAERRPPLRCRRPRAAPTEFRGSHFDPAQMQRDLLMQIPHKGHGQGDVH